MNKKLLEILVCPICKGKLIYKEGQQELICKFDSIIYPIENGIPVMLEEAGRRLSLEEKDKL
ncbi:MAG: tetraacyldisaccharide 4'-kinase [Gammaproteobacteria bacterium RIFCSPLOWO2_02_FULL_38_11]|nr:MAG: tetraacyldisaccharide 4'-kinase [Gammaproteobacteria bacterium RIFCSPHIGHO2_02_FULL_38_33]OGT24074.1 MAG: tetraacyldisaccharide 4'-kinase [Gammaproteobacteria bacterium RIFCSPHIGHO2_12_38_15]OGT67411.1 MAG: tetraacyldisaccharide 4'-kinase [Gammaproteobacteria bacterium RIFCSPLOWO2_02_FULL_38_11]OGT76581.1 MAG: tetraacyldisaccharide 4'-kinase [Gammaproteobacteria bacterium RIFCSPLOWO2_12_FULL_38_14]